MDPNRFGRFKVVDIMAALEETRAAREEYRKGMKTLAFAILFCLVMITILVTVIILR